ncbi:hypothetical protein [Gillisia marina]|uniref:hypothetical protein n=1 Tax=Gillisia marina TaxID=1167637 RepID=UPI000299F7C1|nr:hypothetical protein [Gillisia marina]
MKVLVNTFSAVLSSTIEMSLSIIDKMPFNNSESEKTTHQLGDFEKGLKAEIEFDLFNRGDR